MNLFGQFFRSRSRQFGFARNDFDPWFDRSVGFDRSVDTFARMLGITIRRFRRESDFPEVARDRYVYSRMTGRFYAASPQGPGYVRLPEFNRVYAQFRRSGRIEFVPYSPWPGLPRNP